MPKQVSLTRKITAAIAIPAALVAAVVVSAISWSEWRLSRHWLIETAQARAKVIAANSTSSLAFDNREDAEEILGSLGTDPQVAGGALFDSEGELFATFVAAGSERASLPVALERRNGYAFADGGLLVYQPVRQNDLWLGTLYLRFSLDALYARLGSFLLTGVLAGVAAFGMALGLAYYLRRPLSLPVLQLAEVARTVSRSKNYEVRAPVSASSYAEAQTLTECFNDMLDRIQDQDASLRASERQFRRAISDAPLPIAIHDEAGSILELSRGWRDVCGTAGEDFGNLFEWLQARCPPAAYARFHETVTHPKPSGATESLGEIEIRLDDGSARLWHANATSIGRFRDGRTVWLFIAMDLTERIRANNALKQRTRELERSNQELDDFAYIASHDMKEPLRGIHNNAMFLDEDFREMLGEEGARRISRMQFLCARLERLINDLLYYSRIGRQDLAIQEVDPNQMVDDIAKMLESALEGQNARIVVPKPMPRCVCDSVRVHEVFRNLITNGLKYNKSPEKIVEVGFLEERDGRRNVFYVKDNGFGISPEFHEEIFRIFKRLNPEAEDAKGTGSGLTFVKKIVERHEGSVWVDSEPGAGSTFCFTLGKCQPKPES